MKIKLRTRFTILNNFKQSLVRIFLGGSLKVSLQYTFLYNISNEPKRNLTYIIPNIFLVLYHENGIVSKNTEFINKNFIINNKYSFMPSSQIELEFPDRLSESNWLIFYF